MKTWALVCLTELYGVDKKLENCVDQIYSPRKVKYVTAGACGKPRENYIRRHRTVPQSAETSEKKILRGYEDARVRLTPN